MVTSFISDCEDNTRIDIAVSERAGRRSFLSHTESSTATGATFVPSSPESSQYNLSDGDILRMGCSFDDSQVSCGGRKGRRRRTSTKPLQSDSILDGCENLTPRWPKSRAISKSLSNGTLQLFPQPIIHQPVNPLLKNNVEKVGREEPGTHARDAQVEDISSRRTAMQTRSMSAIDLLFDGNCSDRDFCPRAPRRRSFNTRSVSNASSKSGANSSGGTSSYATSISADDLQSHVMTLMPEAVKKSLPKDHWEHIFSTLAEKVNDVPFLADELKANIPCSEEVGTAMEYKMVDTTTKKLETKEVDERLYEDLSINNGNATVASALTSPSIWKDDEKHTASRLSVSPKPLACPELPPRSWHVGTPSNEGAPRMPSRSRLFGPRQSSTPVVSTKESFAPPLVARRFSTSVDTGPMANIIKDPFRKVQFSHVQVRYHERILVVNPSTSSGPSVGLGWEYEDDKNPMDLRFHLRDKVTSARDVLLSRSVREDLLRRLGYSRAEIAKAIRLNLKLKNQRSQTYNNLRHQKVEYLFEKSKRKVGKLLRFRSSSRRLGVSPVEVTGEE